MDHQHSSILESTFLSEKTPLQRTYWGRLSSGEPVFIKQCTSYDLNTASGALLSEAQHLIAMRDPGVVQVLKKQFERVEATGEYRFALCLEWMENSLATEIARGRKWREEELWKCLKALITVLKKGQLRQFAHRNISPKSVFFQGDIVKLGSFAYSAIGPSDPLLSEISLRKQAKAMEPGLLERFSRKMASEEEAKLTYNMHKADVYALGLTMLMMSKGDKICRKPGNEELELKGEIEKLPFSRDWKGFLGLMLLGNETIRPDFLQLSETLEQIRPDLGRISDVSTRPSSRMTGNRPSAYSPVNYAQLWLSELLIKPEESLRKLFLFNKLVTVTVVINLRCHHCGQIYKQAIIEPYIYLALLFCSVNCRLEHSPISS